MAATRLTGESGDAEPLCDAERHERHADAEHRHDSHHLHHSVFDVLFNHDGTDDADCDVSDG